MSLTKREKSLVSSMEFKKFVNAFVRVPAQVVRTGRRLLFRLSSWNTWPEVFLRRVDRLRAMATSRRPRRC